MMNRYTFSRPVRFCPAEVFKRIVFLSLLATSLLAGCRESTTASDGRDLELLGKSCTVQFRRDALGGTSPNLVGPTVDDIDGSTISISGKMTAISPHWLVLDASRKEIRIPRDVILCLEFEHSGNQPAGPLQARPASG